MRIVFMGTPEFAVPSLKRLTDKGHEIVLVVTQPDRRGNRGRVAVSPVKELAEAYGMNVAQPFSIKKDEQFMSELERLAPDMIVVAAFGQLLPKRVLEIPKYGCINVHGSLLPKLRGAAPMQYAILNGDEETGVTIMRMAEGLDTGDMISSRSIRIGNMDIEELSLKLSDIGAELLADTTDDIESGRAVYVKQNDEISTYAHMIRKTDGATGFSGSASGEERKIRAFKNWPNSYSYLRGKQVKFYAAEVLDEEEDGAPGSISTISEDEFTINCGEGKLRINELQIQGRKRMSAADFMRGHSLSRDDFFTLEEI